jgi:hypothetical protein
MRASGAEYKIDQADFESATGVGVVVTKEMIEATVDTLFAEHAD